MTLGLAREYELALRASDRPWIDKLQSQGLPTDDHDLLDSYRLDPVGKSAPPQKVWGANSRVS